MLLGNLLGIVFASISGWENIEIGRPGGVALGAVQGFIGASLAMGAGQQFLKNFAPVDFWLKLFVIFSFGLVAVALILTTLNGTLDQLLTWKSGAGVTGLLGIEFGRRVGKENW